MNVYCSDIFYLIKFLAILNCNVAFSSILMSNKIVFEFKCFQLRFLHIKFLVNNDIMNTCSMHIVS